MNATFLFKSIPSTFHECIVLFQCLVAITITIPHKVWVVFYSPPAS